jgi:hypothetical protein
MQCTSQVVQGLDLGQQLLNLQGHQRLGVVLNVLHTVAAC